MDAALATVLAQAVSVVCANCHMICEYLPEDRFGLMLLRCPHYHFSLRCKKRNF